MLVSIKMKKWDKIIIVMLLIITFIPYLLVKSLFAGNFSQAYAYITVDGKFYKEIPLTGQIVYKEFMIETQKGSNKVVIENESIAVVEADCHDGVCKEFGFVSKPGEVIVCLPHGVYIEVKGQQIVEDEVDIRAY